MEHPVNRLNRIQKEIKNPIGNWGVGYIAELMQEYAEEYHQSKVNNVVLDDVICCECSDNFSTPEVELNKCFSCGKKLHCN
tara:strand:- start:49 stop:291 length:243 start_codon:yes stop_codon:yes gene_type:complete